MIQYFADVYPVKVEAVGYRSLYDSENVKPRFLRRAFQAEVDPPKYLNDDERPLHIQRIPAEGKP